MPATDPAAGRGHGRGKTHGTAVTLALAACLAAAALLALGSGPRPMPPQAVLDGLFAFDPGNFDHQALWLFRLPRLLAALIVGGALALAGALMQTLVRNPLAEPQLLGLNAGAALAVVAASVFGPPLPGLSRPMMAAAGAFVAFAAVLALSSVGRNGPTPLKLTFCGIIVSAFASALTTAILLLDEQAIEELRLWLSGDLAGQTYPRLGLSVPFFLLGAGLALLLSPRLGALALGDAVAAGLGVDVKSTRLLTLLAAAILVGCAVTLGGPIGFIGLIVPQLLRRLVGDDLRRTFLACLLAGPALLLLADTLARVILSPAEISTGIVTGAAGACVLIPVVARTFK